jgi:N-formylglutamate deformylase
MTDTYFEIRRGNSPLILSIPHLGTVIPAELRDRYTPEALAVVDTDWHLDKLYAFATELDATVMQATVSRYVIDLNRPASGESLYPGMVTTSLCPSETFRGEPLYLEGCAPDDEEMAKRVAQYWRPYHAGLQAEVARLRATHANILLWEAHSIASVLPRLFPGKLPDLNFGTSDGDSCSENVIAAALEAVRGGPHSWVLNGRFKGGFITRRYGAPLNGVHAIQLEMCQSLYMDEAAPFGWRPDLAGDVARIVRACVRNALAQVERLGSPAPKERAHILPG